MKNIVTGVVRLTNIIAHDAAGTRVDRQLAEEEVRRATFDILQANVLCSVATVTPAGSAHISTAHFCYSDDLQLYFLSHPHSMHCQNLATNSSIAVTVFSSSQQWLAPGAGVQLFGTGIAAEGAEAKKAEELYGNRFSAYSNWKATRAGDISSEYRFYGLVVLRLKVLDEANIGDGVFVSAAVVRM
jgi:uncharacterized protein YhbP (UPF0306 family)